MYEMYGIDDKDIKKAILGAGLTVTQVCEKAGVTRSAASKLFKGENSGVRKKLIKALDELTKKED